MDVLASLNDRASAMLIAMPWRKTSIPVSTVVPFGTVGDRLQSIFMHSAFAPVAPPPVFSGGFDTGIGGGRRRKKRPPESETEAETEHKPEKQQAKSIGLYPIDIDAMIALARAEYEKQLVDDEAAVIMLMFM